MSSRVNTRNYEYLFVNDIPLMDVRAPVEFNKGSFPCAHNVPLLDDEQRRLIGTKYTQANEQEAIQLGLTLATPNIRKQRLEDWNQFCNHHPDGYLFCFRGGLRSKTTQQWLKETGTQYPLIEGGYKAMRRFLIDEFEQNLKRLEFLVIAGPTGSGKTDLLKKLPYYVDLEGRAKHRGSAFGRTVDCQPTQIDWENSISVDLLKHHFHHKNRPIFIEDESRLIGRIYLPVSLQKLLASTSSIELAKPLTERIELIRKDYIEIEYPKYLSTFGDQGHIMFKNQVLGNLQRIKKRLGGVRYEQVYALFEEGLKRLEKNTTDKNGYVSFEQAIHTLLTQYYDPMYKYQESKKPSTILFKGNEQEIIEWIKHQYSNTLS